MEAFREGGLEAGEIRLSDLRDRCKRPAHAFHVQKRTWRGSCCAVQYSLRDPTHPAPRTSGNKMPVVPCPHCSKPVTLPTPWTGSAYTCPHCRRGVATATPPAPPPPPVPPPLSLPDEDYEPEPRSRPRRRPSGNPVGDFLTFRLMITPLLIQLVFYAGVMICIGVGVRAIAGSFDAAPDSSRTTWDARDTDRFTPDLVKQKAKTEPARQFSAVQFGGGLAIILVGPLMIRLYCELLIIIFKIHDELKSSNDRHRYRT